MKAINTVILAAAALAVSVPALAGRDQAQVAEQERAVQKLKAEKALAGPAGPQGQAGPATKRGPAAYNFGHPTERVRR